HRRRFPCLPAMSVAGIREGQIAVGFRKAGVDVNRLLIALNLPFCVSEPPISHSQVVKSLCALWIDADGEFVVGNPFGHVPESDPGIASVSDGLGEIWLEADGPGASFYLVLIPAHFPVEPAKVTVSDVAFRTDPDRFLGLPDRLFKFPQLPVSHPNVNVC